MVYSSRFALLMRRLNTVMIYSRPMAYASELGESIRPLVSGNVVKGLYLVSWLYVIIDTFAKSIIVRDQGRKKMLYYAMDTAIWHTFASMALPAFTIHSLVKYSGKISKYCLNPASKLGRYGPTALGALSIPFIIHPLDHFTDWAMDRSLRTLYAHNLPHVEKHH